MGSGGAPGSGGTGRGSSGISGGGSSIGGRGAPGPLGSVSSGNGRCTRMRHSLQQAFRAFKWCGSERTQGRKKGCQETTAAIRALGRRSLVNALAPRWQRAIVDSCDRRCPGGHCEVETDGQGFCAGRKPGRSLARCTWRKKRAACTKFRDDFGSHLRVSARWAAARRMRVGYGGNAATLPLIDDAWRWSDVLKSAGKALSQFVPREKSACSTFFEVPRPARPVLAVLILTQASEVVCTGVAVTHEGDTFRCKVAARFLDVSMIS